MNPKEMHPRFFQGLHCSPMKVAYDLYNLGSERHEIYSSVHIW